MLKKIRKAKTKCTSVVIMALLLTASLAGCTSEEVSAIQSSISGASMSETPVVSTSSGSSDTSSGGSVSTLVTSFIGESLLDGSGLFTERDLEQSADLSEASYIELTDGEDIIIDTEGVYVLSGDVVGVTVTVEADDEAKVQLVLDGVSIVNDDAPALYVKSADKVFVTLTDSSNYMEVTNGFEADGDVNLDAVIFSKEDLVLNGTGTLNIVSAEGNGITSKDDLKVTGGTYSVVSLLDGLEANDSVRIAGGDIAIFSYKDAIHSENEDDSSLGYIYIYDGTLNISAADDAIHGNSIVQIDGGVINIETCMEGIEGTYVQINGGDITIYAKDDGINATARSGYDVVIETNGGTIDVSMAGGDTDAFDSNGTIYVNGGTIDISAVSAFDPNGTAELNGGTVTVNGEVITEIIPSQMGPGGLTGPGGKFRR